MAWNGTRLVFSVTEQLDPETENPSDVLIGLDDQSRGLKDWKIGGRVNRLFLDGKGKGLLVERDDGALLSYTDWEKGESPLPKKGLGRFLGISEKKGWILLGEAEKVKVFSDQFKSLWSFNADSVAGFQLFPFLKKERQILLASDDGRVSLYNGKELVWKAVFPSPPTAIASSFLEDGLVAVAGGMGELRFFAENGSLMGKTVFPDKVSSLSCSNIGNVCAAYGNGPDGQRIILYTPKGIKLGEYFLKETADYGSSVVVAANGEIIIAGIQEDKSWSLRAWDGRLEPLWVAPIEGGLSEFKVSWNGRRIAVLTHDARIAFFNIKDEPS